MSSTVFTGPVLAGNVLNSDGTGALSGVGGSSGTQNVGFCQMAQSAAITQSATAAATAIVIPAQSQILDIYVGVTTAWSGGTLSIGTTSAANELATGLTCAAGQTTVAVTTLMSAWNNTSSTQDVQIWVKSSAGTAGVAVLTVCYLQGINGFTNGQYT
jgi:hypothetical protein